MPLDAWTWRCPRCRGALDEAADRLRCDACSRTYPLLGGIPDLRIERPHWIDVDQDRRHAERLLELAPSRTAAELVADVFGRRQGWTDRDRARRACQVFEATTRLGRELDDWLLQPTTGTSPFLDLGCGAGQLLAAASRRGRAGVGVDVSLEWLVVARQVIREAGGTPVLAAALAEALPLADGAAGGVVSLDVIEHVGDQPRYLQEIARVLGPAGVCAIATPNRFSLAAEPHVGVWGVGWLPRRWQARYVGWRSGKPYRYCRLLSSRELRALFRDRGLEPEIRLAAIPFEELAHFSRARAAAARLYNRLIGYPVARRSLALVAPFFQVLARKPSRDEAPARLKGAPEQSLTEG